MKKAIRNISLVFSAGCIGGLLNSLVVWWFGSLGLPAKLGVKIAPALTLAWLYPRIVWGGLWGVLFLLPLWTGRHLLRGLVFSLGPTAMMLFYIFPTKAQKGMMGMALGDFTPLFVVFYNAVWGVSAAIWLAWAGRMR